MDVFSISRHIFYFLLILVEVFHSETFLTFSKLGGRFFQSVDVYDSLLCLVDVCDSFLCLVEFFFIQ